MEKEHLEILLEEMRSKFDLVLEGHDALRQEIRGSEERLSARIDHVDFKLNTLNTKIDHVKDDLAAHRADTEAHPRWQQVREPSE